MSRYVGPGMARRIPPPGSVQKELTVHELSVMSSMLDIVREHADKNGANKVIRINLRIGTLSDIIPDWAQTYFDMLSKDTIADGATLEIESIPVSVKCAACGHVQTFEKKEWKFQCVRCESSDIELLSGREFSITSIEIV